MRHFTKSHNDLKWLFPIAKTKKEASKIFDYVEKSAKDRCDAAAIPEKDKDLAIDAYMKGYSDALQLEIPQMRNKLFQTIYGERKAHGFSRWMKPPCQNKSYKLYLH